MDFLFDAFGWEGWVTLGLFGLVVVLLYREWRSPDITLFLGACVLIILGIVSPWEFIQGFADETLITIAMVCVVMRAVEAQGVMGQIATKVYGHFKNYTLQLLSMLVPTSFLSAFFNNTPVVLFLTPLVRTWALKNNFSPSKFLIPLSYASLMGGLCTLIGTSTNLVVQSLLVRQDPWLTFTFFELGKIGLPILILGYIYLLIFAKKLLPDRRDVIGELSDEVREYTVEFLVSSECPLIGKQLGEKTWTPFKGAVLLTIERKGGSIDSPTAEEFVLDGDRLVFAGDIQDIAHLHTIEGLKSQADPLFKLEVTSPYFAEIIIPTTSLFIGKTLKQLNFRNLFGASVFAIYRKGEKLRGNVGNIYLRAGDTLMLLSNHHWLPEDKWTNDFLLLRFSERVPLFEWKRGLFVVGVSIAMVVATIAGLSIFLSSITAAFVLVVTRSITVRECRKSIPWNLLLLIVSSFAFGKALFSTGVAKTFAEGVLLLSGTDPYYLIGAILLVTIVATELITNVAAVVLIFPLALETMLQAGYNSLEAIKAVGVAVAVAGSSGYAMPTGYQTHLIVYGPGGYKFIDFLKIGLPLDIMVWALATALIPTIWRFA